MEWTKEHDIYLCRDITTVEPFQSNKGTVARGQLWTIMAQSLNS